MSSFSQFKKSQQLHKSNRSNSRDSFKSFEMEGGNLANLSFNTDQIVFRLVDGEDTATNRQLRVANHTDTRLYYQVSASRSEYFDIRPRQDILEVDAVVSITFRFNKRKVLEQGDQSTPVLNKINDFLRNNLLQFEWGPITEQNIKYNEIPQTKNRQILKSRAEEGESRVRIEDKLKGVMKMSEKQIEKQIPSRQFSPTKPYDQQLDMKENRMMGEPKGFELSSKTSLQGDNTEYSSLLTIPIIVAVAFCSFVVGYISA